MAKYYNRTTLYSGANASSVSLSEPVSNFEYIEIGRGNCYRLIETSCNWNLVRMNMCAFWSNQGYMDVEYLFKITNNGSGLQAINYNFLMQEAKDSQRLLGSATNRANNIKFFSEVYGINRTAGTSATATTVPPQGTGWTRYNETLLCSASAYGQSSFTLSEPASAFGRLRVCVGNSGEARNSWEVNSPSADGDDFVVRSNWGANTGTNAFSISTYGWGSGTTVCSAQDGKHFSPGWASANPWNGVGTASKTANWIAHPIYAIYGINRK